MTTTHTQQHALVHLRFETKQLDALRELARREDRSVTAEVRRAVARHLEQADEGAKEDQ